MLTAQRSRVRCGGGLASCGMNAAIPACCRRRGPDRLARRLHPSSNTSARSPVCLHPFRPSARLTGVRKGSRQSEHMSRVGTSGGANASDAVPQTPGGICASTCSSCPSTSPWREQNQSSNANWFHVCSFLASSLGCCLHQLSLLYRLIRPAAGHTRLYIHLSSRGRQRAVPS